MEELKEIIETRGIKLEWLAGALGISRKTLYCKLNGESSFKLSEINILASMFNLSGDDIKRIFLVVK